MIQFLTEALDAGGTLSRTLAVHLRDGLPLADVCQDDPRNFKLEA
jgi:hypothetical protein